MRSSDVARRMALPVGCGEESERHSNRALRLGPRSSNEEDVTWNRIQNSGSMAATEEMEEEVPAISSNDSKIGMLFFHIAAYHQARWSVLDHGLNLGTNLW